MNSKVHMYADDVQLYNSTCNEDLYSYVDIINNDLDKISTWANVNGLCINPSKSKCLVLSKSSRTFRDLHIKIDDTKIELVKSATNLGVIFNTQLTWSNHINMNVGRVYGMLRNLWPVKDSTPFFIRLLLAKTYLIPVLLYGCEIYANCDGDDFQKLNVAYNNIARYIFLKGRHDHISLYSHQIFQLNFKNLLKFKCLIFLHKIITSGQPTYLFNRIKFARSNRGKKIIQQRYKSLLSQRQFLIYVTSLWNSLPNRVQNLGNAKLFKKELSNILM